jgi:alpha-beta hydrolase superfamily lysophospholipase
MPDRRFYLPNTADGQRPVVHCWDGAGRPSGVLLIAHGMSEYALRYAHLAERLVKDGWSVYGNDHRGHGQTVKETSQLGDYGPDGWRGLVDDEIEILRRLREEHDVPILIMGHSMGSMLVQHLLTEASGLVDGAALSGTTAVDVMAGAMQNVAMEDDTDPFASFNAAFEPVRTQSDWLSRDPHEVDLYVNDPACGFSVRAESLGSLMEAGVAFSTERETERIRKDLPIYLFAGDADPVGMGGELVKTVAERYRSAGIRDVSIKLYPGARHEVFNETNRAEVETDFVTWASRVREATQPRGSSE